MGELKNLRKWKKVKNEELCRSLFELEVRNRKELSHCMPALLNCDYLLDCVEDNSKAESRVQKKGIWRPLAMSAVGSGAESGNT